MAAETCMDHESRLEEVLADFLAADAGGTPPERAELLRCHPDLASELTAFFADHDRMRCVTEPVRQLLAGVRPTDEVPCAGRRIGDYELLAELGRGGMGVVFKARHTSLNRLVALKMILAGELASAAEVRRLRTEAEAVAALDHPHIVPLYEVGEHAGQPYFTMKLIEGERLTARLPHFRQDLRSAAALVATLARAVHHAHERGILHRDLKPANVLLDGAGQPYLTDFGLARRVGGLPGPTSTGIAVGTPCYIAPEQAAGPAHAITTAADVYGLGALLYELLTGRPPFTGALALEVLRQVLENESPRPQTLNPAVSRDLETIALKCLQKDPARRYPSALALAEDLEAYLRGEPIRARPVSKAARVWHWCRRRPLVASLLLALGVSVMAGLGTALWLWQEAEEARALAEQRLQEVQEQQAREEESFRQAHRAVHEYSHLLSAELDPIPGMQALRKKTLERTRAYYEDFLKRRHDPALRAELVEARFGLAEVMRALDSRAGARAEAEQARALCEELLRDDPANLPLRRRLAALDVLLGELLNQQGDAAAGLHYYTRAARLYEQLVQEQPADREARTGLAQVANSIGSLHREAGRSSEAGRAWQQALALYEQLRTEDPDSVRLRMGLARNLHNLAILAVDEDRPAQALEIFQRSADLQRRLVQEFPQSREFRHGLGVALHHLALQLGAAGKKTEARQLDQEALALREPLARENPDVLAYQVALASSLLNVGRAQSADGRRADALAGWRRATGILEGVVRRDPGRMQAQLDLMRCQIRLGQELVHAGQRPEAIAAYQSACSVGTKLVAAAPEQVSARGEFARALNNLAVLLSEAGRPAEARPLVQQAIEQGQHLLAAVPGSTTFRRELGINLSLLGKVEREAGHYRAAADALRARIPLLPDDGRELVQTTRELALLAGAVPAAQEREGYVDLALQTLRQALDAGYRDFTRLRKSSDLEILRQRPEFSTLVRSYEEAR